MQSDRNIYLKMKTLEEAREILFRRFRRLERFFTEAVAVPDAVGRVLAEPVSARLSSPNFHAAAMDGIAVQAERTYGARESRPVVCTIGKDAHYVNTGHVLPENTDAVIMIEHVHEVDAHHVAVEAPAFPWQNVRKMGEDIVATEMLFPQNHMVTPYCVGALLSGGISSVIVRKKPRLLMIPTGSELVSWQDAATVALQPGQVIESNSFVLGKLTESWGGEYERHPLLSDDLHRIKETVAGAVAGRYDMVLIIGGSSAGSEDFAKRVIAELGEVFVHGVTIMPGKPVIIGAVQETPVFGIPGYQVSAIVAFEQFVRPLICRMLGIPEEERPRVWVEPTRKIPSKLGVEEFLRVKLGRVGDRIVATPLPRGAGCITTITQADGIIRIPNHMEGLPEGRPVEAELLRPLTAIENTLVIVGSHDNTLDVLADHIKAKQSRLTLSSSHVGSMGGLMALRRGVCHLAGTHLLDTEDGSYNLSYIRKYLADVPVRVVNLVLRDQGLIIAKGNPKKIFDIADLARNDVRFVNRQGGSGTRILFDYKLEQADISRSAITGYEDEEFTHMSVAAAVLSGRADAGLGIHAAARALGLDFIPVITEQYDLVIPRAYFDWKPMGVLLDTIHSAAFKKQVAGLGGYHTEKTGQVIEPLFDPENGC